MSGAMVAAPTDSPRERYLASEVESTLARDEALDDPVEVGSAKYEQLREIASKHWFGGLAQLEAMSPLERAESWCAHFSRGPLWPVPAPEWSTQHGSPVKVESVRDDNPVVTFDAPEHSSGRNAAYAGREDTLDLAADRIIQGPVRVGVVVNGDLVPDALSPEEARALAADLIAAAADAERIAEGSVTS